MHILMKFIAAYRWGLLGCQVMHHYIITLHHRIMITLAVVEYMLVGIFCHVISRTWSVVSAIVFPLHEAVIILTSQWARQRLKSPACPMFAQPFVHAQISENIPRHCPLWGVTGEFPAQMASNAENVSIWWRHHGYIVSAILFPLYGVCLQLIWIFFKIYCISLNCALLNYDILVVL